MGQEEGQLATPVGIVAGNGEFPIECIRRGKGRGLNIVAIAHRCETKPDIDTLEVPVLWLRVGQLGKILRFFRAHKVKTVIFSGGIRRTGIFQGARPDWRAIKVITRVGSLRDDEILRGIAEEFSSNGMSVLGAEMLLEDSIPSAGCLTKRSMIDSERKSALVGWKAAFLIGSLDIGQTVCVKDGVVVSVEAAEGTDAAIERAGRLAGPGVIVVKRAKPQQDVRLDLPAIGEETIKTMSRCKASGIVLEDSRALLLHPDRVVGSANRSNLFIDVWPSELS
jgi:DUF1009 family protein